jgi:predicted ATPase
MIRQVQFRNFKGLRHVDVDLERFTALVGPNASGKTTVLEGLHYLSQVLSIPPQTLLQAERNPFLLYSRGGEGEMRIVGRGADGQVRLTASTQGSFPEDILTPDQSARFQDRWSLRVEYDKTSDGEHWAHLDSGPNTAIRFSFGNSVLLRLSPARLARPSVAGDTKPQIQPDGEGFPSFLAYMALNRPERFEQLQKFLRAVVPAVQKIRFDRVRVSRIEPEPYPGNERTGPLYVDRAHWADSLIFDFEGAPDIPGHMASEGTLLIVGLLAGLQGPPRPNLVLLDDLDHGLHPKAQRDFIAQLRKVLEQHPKMQIVATTHSPYLLDSLEAKEVRLTALKADGSVACARLDEHPDFEKWKDEMAPGEFWSLVGEKWVRDQQAVESK